MTFRRESDSAAARDRLREALRVNRRVAKYLDGATVLPDLAQPIGGDRRLTRSGDPLATSPERLRQFHARLTSRFPLAGGAVAASRQLPAAAA